MGSPGSQNCHPLGEAGGTVEGRQELALAAIHDTFRLLEIGDAKAAWRAAPGLEDADAFILYGFWMDSDDVATLALSAPWQRNGETNC